jgi:hypothetical protein
MIKERTTVRLSQVGREVHGDHKYQGGGGVGQLQHRKSTNFESSFIYVVYWESLRNNAGGIKYNNYRRGEIEPVQNMRIEGNELILEEL